jgi:hypothetical protein
MVEKKQDIKLIWKDPNTLIPYENNAKEHLPEQIEAIAHQIKTVGFDQPIVVNPKNVIIKGHGRREAALKLGLKRVPVIVVKLSPEIERATRIGDNKVAEASWLHDILKLEFTGISNLDPAIIKLTGFGEDEFESIMEGWKTDLAKVEETIAHTDGIFSVIKIVCKPEIKEELKTFLTKAIHKSKYTGVEVG